MVAVETADGSSDGFMYVRIHSPSRVVDLWHIRTCIYNTRERMIHIETVPCVHTTLREREMPKIFRASRITMGLGKVVETMRMRFMHAKHHFYQFSFNFCENFNNLRYLIWPIVQAVDKL